MLDQKLQSIYFSLLTQAYSNNEELRSLSQFTFFGSKQPFYVRVVRIQQMVKLSSSFFGGIVSDNFPSARQPSYTNSSEIICRKQNSGERRRFKFSLGCSKICSRVPRKQYFEKTYNEYLTTRNWFQLQKFYVNSFPKFDCSERSFKLDIV